MKIGIMGAMHEEIASVKASMANLQEEQHGDRTYYTGTIHGHCVVLTFSRWGKVASAITATTLVTLFHIDQLIFTGVAGATSATLNIGDIVIADTLYQHDMDGRPIIAARHEIPLTGITFFATDSTLKARARSAIEQLFVAFDQIIPLATRLPFVLTQPKCVEGMIATGDQFITTKAQTHAIISTQPATLAVEMEGAAVAQVCYDYQIPFVIIRTISDRADHDANIDFPTFITEIARYYSAHIIQCMLDF